MDVGDPVPVGMFMYVHTYMLTDINLKCCFSDTVQHGFDEESLIGLEFAGWAGLLSKQAPEITNTSLTPRFFHVGHRIKLRLSCVGSNHLKDTAISPIQRFSFKPPSHGFCNKFEVLQTSC